MSPTTTSSGRSSCTAPTSFSSFTFSTWPISASLSLLSIPCQMASQWPTETETATLTATRTATPTDIQTVTSMATPTATSTVQSKARAHVKTIKLLNKLLCFTFQKIIIWQFTNVYSNYKKKNKVKNKIYLNL